MKKLNLAILCKQAEIFSMEEDIHNEKTLYGVTDGKKVGTYIEQKFREFLHNKNFEFDHGSAAVGVDFPSLNVDIKTTSNTQPQSSCPFKSAEQKIYGLGYSLIVFVYEKTDNQLTKTANLHITDTIFVDAERTADFQITKGILEILARKGNSDDLFAFLTEKNLPLDEIGMVKLAEKLLQLPPKQGYLTISNALQWRLQYKRVIDEAGSVDGLKEIYRGKK